MKAAFLTALVVEREAGDNWKLMQALVFRSEVAGVNIIVPAGFVTNFASVPRLPLAYWLFGNVADEAATVHDFLYSNGALPRDQCDGVFREASAVAGVAGWRRGAMWLGVRLFGGSHYTAQAVNP